MSDQEATLDEFVNQSRSKSKLQSTPTGSYTSDWPIVRSGDYFALRNGEFLKSNERSEDAEYPVYGGNGVMGYTSETNVPEDQIIIGRVGAYCGNVHKTTSEAWVTDNSIILTNESEDFSNEYLKYLLTSVRLGQFSEQSAQPRISQSTIDNLRIPNPPLSEQRKIATVLDTVDQAIEKTEEIETQLHRVKKGAKQRLFTYGLNNEVTQGHRVGDFPESWQFDKISNLAKIERGNTPRTSHDEYYGGDITWVTPDDLSDLNEDGNGKYISDSGRKLTPEGVESSSLTVVEPDSVMFTSRSYGIGRTAICTVPAATNQGITAFECNENLDTEFFYYYLNYIMDYVVSISGGSTFPEISKSATGNIDVPVPKIDEQKEIASILSQFDEQILHNREVTTQLKRFKHGLQQDLLSGTVRTTDTTIEVPDEIAQHG